MHCYRCSLFVFLWAAIESESQELRNVKCRVRPDICIFLSPAITSFRRAASSRSAEAAAIQLNFRESAGTSEALLRAVHWCPVLHVCAADATALLCACMLCMCGWVRPRNICVTACVSVGVARRACKHTRFSVLLVFAFSGVPGLYGLSSSIYHHKSPCFGGPSPIVTGCCLHGGGALLLNHRSLCFLLLLYHQCARIITGTWYLVYSFLVWGKPDLALVYEYVRTAVNQNFSRFEIRVSVHLEPMIPLYR